MFRLGRGRKMVCQILNQTTFLFSFYQGTAHPSATEQKQYCLTVHLFVAIVLHYCRNKTTLFRIGATCLIFVSC